MDLLGDNNKKKRSFDGPRTPPAKISVKIDNPDEQIVVDGKKVSITGIMLSHGVDGLEPGKEYTFTARDKKIDKLVEHMTNDNKLKKHLKKKVVLTLEGVYANDKSFLWTTNLAREVKMGDTMTEVALAGQMMQFKEFKGNDGLFHNASVMKTNDALPVAGAGTDKTKAFVADLVEQLSAYGDELDEASVDLLERAKNFDNLTAFEQMGVVFDYQFMTEDDMFAGKGYDMVLRVIQLNKDTSTEEAFGAAYINGGMERIEDGDEVSYVHRDFASAVSKTLGVPYEDIVSKGVVEAMSGLAKEGEEGGVTYGKDSTDFLVSLVSFLQSDAAKSDDLKDQLMVEAIPSANLTLGKMFKDHLKDKPIEDFRSPVDGHLAPKRGKYRDAPVVLGDLQMMSFMEEDDNGMKTPNGAYFVNKMRVTYPDFNGGPSKAAYRPTFVPTINTADIEGLNANIESLSQAYVKQLNNKSNDNDNANENDGQENEQGQDQQASPSMG